MQSSRGMKTLASGAYKQTPASAQKVMDTFAKYKACAVLRTPKAEQCGPAMQAAIDGVNDLDAVKSGAGSAKAKAKKPTTTTFQDHFSGQTFGSSTVSFIIITSYD